MRAADCEFIQSGRLTANTLQCYQLGTDKCWDEMLKVTELGDGATFKPWQLGVYQDRRLYYGPVSNTPVGYVRGGVRWRVDGMNDLINYVIVRYTDEAGAAQADIVASRPESIAKYGQREMRLERTYIPTASATALARQYMYDHQWPKMRAVGCGRDIQVYDAIGCNNAKAPWIVQPGVYRDVTLPPFGVPYVDWLASGQDFLVDEVVASEKGVQLRTSKWEEIDAMDAYYEYVSDLPDEPKKRRKKKKRRAVATSTTGGSGGGSDSGSGSTGGGGNRERPKDLPI